MINTDKKQLIFADNKQLLFGDLTYKVRGAVFAVFNELGQGHKEGVYQKALEMEFVSQEIPYSREESLKVSYKGKTVGWYRPDFVIDKKIVVELKAVEYLTKSAEDQLLHYLKSTDYQLGLLINFGTPNVYIKRIIFTKKPNLRKSESSSARIINSKGGGIL